MKLTLQQFTSFSNTVLKVLLSLLRMAKVERQNENYNLRPPLFRSSSPPWPDSRPKSFSVCRWRLSVGIYDEPSGSTIGDTSVFRAQACYTRRQG